MHFPGRFADQLMADQLHNVSLSFLVDDLVIRRGGVAPNICYGMAQLGAEPVLIGAVGEDFDDYRSWLERKGVDCNYVHVSLFHHTARFVCTTDDDLCQIGSFYTGAMAEARQIELKPIADKVGGLDLVIISPNDPEAMQRHTDECRTRGYPFIADPSQQMAWMQGPDIKRLIDGATYLFSNDYEDGLISQKTGWTHDDILARVGTRIITRGKSGASVEVKGQPRIDVPIAPEAQRLDPTGVGDAFRAGFVAGLSWGMSLTRCAQIGSVLSSYVIAIVGTQEYRFNGTFLSRFKEAYGPEAAADIATRVKQLNL
ncbi:MAG: adenosine kinase [Actinomycetota bacterium]|nr:adenosine kinase [Actinomycetota bacterium]